MRPQLDGRETWLPTMQHIAQEGRCFVLSSNRFARRRDYPADYTTQFGDDPDTVRDRPRAARFRNDVASAVPASDRGTDQ